MKYCELRVRKSAGPCRTDGLNLSVHFTPVRQTAEVWTLALLASSHFDDCTCLDDTLLVPTFVSVRTRRTALLRIDNRMYAVDFRTPDLRTGARSAVLRADAPVALRLADRRAPRVDPPVRVKAPVLQARPAALVRSPVAPEAVRLPQTVLDRAEGASAVARTVTAGARVRTELLAGRVRIVAVLTGVQSVRRLDDDHLRRRRRRR